MTSERRNFDSDAETWDEVPARVQLAADVFNAIVREAGPTRDMDVLDFGCGTGLVTLRLAPLVRSVTGADSSEGMLAVFRRKAARDGLTNAVAERLDPERPVIPGGPYDLIVSSMTFHHVEHTAPLIERLFRSLKSSGRLCIADLDPDQGKFHDDNTGVFHFGFDRMALRREFMQAGFAAVSDATAAVLTKPGDGGAPRQFSVFLLTGRKGPP
jgi:ubiquinone/menaquinone biosynthesis C-methylase UbiE